MLRLGSGRACVRRTLRFVLPFLSETGPSRDSHPGNLTSGSLLQSLLYEHGTRGGQVCSWCMEYPVPRHHIGLCGHDTTNMRHAPVCAVAPVLLSRDPFHFALPCENPLIDRIEGIRVATDIVRRKWFLGGGGVETWRAIAGCGGLH